MKKAFLLLIALSLLSTFSCKKDKTDGEVKLQLFHYKQEIVNELKEITALFKEKYPNITIETETIPNDAQTVLKTKLQSGEAPEIMMLQSYTTVFDYAEAGYLLDLSKEAFMQRIVAGAKKSVTFKGSQYAVPMDMAGIGVIYNKDIFAKYNIAIPQTLDELKGVCDVLNKNGIIPFAVSISDNWPLGHFFSMAHTAFIGDKLDTWIKSMNDGVGSFKSEDMNRAFEVFDFYKNNAGPKAMETTYNNQYTNFASGKYAMMVQGLWAYGTGSKTVNPALKAGFFPFPFTNDPSQTKLYVDTDSTLAVSATASPEKIDAAKKFLDFLTGDEGVKLWVEKCKLIPTVKGANVDSLDEPYQDLMKYINEGKIMPWAFSIWPVTVFEQSKVAMQEYYSGQKNKDQVMEYLDNLWKISKGMK
ncbi:MAG TPA: extracellular solute-binding protein [Spirochaetota bacterium]|jgi:raffinose/stachyose/melibiose transport system substrate-binding protein|nr:extracellular solute-binding protein [Spirochaetota bacterium]HQB61122.1 extracellular solute-binding protein [Spirochaetota bacterium]